MFLAGGQTHNYSPNIEGCATISDSSGSLLFYTDGETVYNRFGNIMPNGSGLAGGQSSSQSSVILPKPNDDGRYYIFTTDDFVHFLQNGLNYSIVDMCADSGRGDVMTSYKNIHLLDTASEKLAVCRHNNGSDYWVVTQKHFTNNFYAYQVSQAGIINTVVSSTGPIHGDGTFPSSFGEMKISPDHLHIALVDGQGCNVFAEVLDFNAATGSISYTDTLLSAHCPGVLNNLYGVSFSPTSNFVYFAKQDTLHRIVQYDVAAHAIGYNMITPQWYVGMQLATDGKIYLVNTSPPSYLSVINNPDAAGSACNFANNALNLNGSMVNYGLPEFLDDFAYPNVNMNCALPLPNFTTANASICPGTCTSFINNSVNATSYLWNFPGATPDTSSAVNPSNICYNTPGNYDVQLIVTNSNGSTTLLLSNYITIYPAPPPQAISQGGDSLFANAGTGTYQWYFNSTLINGATDYFYLAQSSGDYNVICTDGNGCEVEAAIFNVLASVESTLNNWQLAIYPNPVSEELEVRIPDYEGKTVSIKVYDMIGAAIRILKPNSKLPAVLDVSLLNRGMYRIEVSSSENNFRSKFVKQ